REGFGSEKGSARMQKPTPFIGVMTAPVPPALSNQIGLPEGFGIVVEEVVPDSPAAAAGVQRYDVLKLLNDQQLVDPNQLALLVRSLGKDKEVSLTILRKGQEQKLTLKIGERMLPERRTSITPSPGDFIPRLDAARERGEDYGRRLQENMKGFQDRVREFQEKVEQWRKNPGGGKPPEAPSFQPPGAPTLPNAPRPPEPPRPSDLLREVRPGGAPQVRVDQDGAVTTWNTAQARIVVKDEHGELEVRTENEHRTVIAKNPAGETIFTGPVDTEEQRRALPEPVRRSLEKVRSQSSTSSSSAAAEISSLENALRSSPPPPRAEREIQ
ncbi:MAG: PDZ domain-containing protein, partial [Chthoniobacteraceae bacterium]